MFISKIAYLLANVVELYTLVLFVRILLTWIPNLNWYTQPLRFLAEITDPLLNGVRKIIPPVGIFDLSPIVVFLALQLLQVLLRSL
jgi:YggT family protein